MKYISFLTFITALLTCGQVQSQLKAKATCPAFEVDILDGKVNGMRPDRAPGEFSSRFPCYTSLEKEGSDSKCNGVIAYKDKDIIFFTGRNYVEIGPTFKGKMSIPLLGTKRGTLFRTLGTPKIKDTHWDAFQTGYGCLILYYGTDNKVRMVRFSTYGTESIQLCE